MAQNTGDFDTDTDTDTDNPGHEGHDVWSLLSRPGTAWCRTCQTHFCLAIHVTQTQVVCCGHFLVAPGIGNTVACPTCAALYGVTVVRMGNTDTGAV